MATTVFKIMNEGTMLEIRIMWATIVQKLKDVGYGYKYKYVSGTSLKNYNYE